MENHSQWVNPSYCHDCHGGVLLCGDRGPSDKSWKYAFPMLSSEILFVAFQITPSQSSANSRNASLHQSLLSVTNGVDFVELIGNASQTWVPLWALRFYSVFNLSPPDPLPQMSRGGLWNPADRTDFNSLKQKKKKRETGQTHGPWGSGVWWREGCEIIVLHHSWVATLKSSDAVWEGLSEDASSVLGDVRLRRCIYIWEKGWE